MKWSALSFSVPLFFLSFEALAVTSAEFYSEESYRYGKFESRVFFAPGEGVISSFFLWKDKSEQEGVYWNELDFEKIRNCSLQTNSIYGDPQGGSEKLHPTLTDLCSGYHTLAFEWTPEAIVWLVDGAEIRRDTGDAAAAYADNAEEGMQIRFNIWPGDSSFGGVFSEVSLPLYQYVAWFQYSEYTPGLGDDGGDFRLSFREELDEKPSGYLFGSWDSPRGHSTHDPQNVSFLDGTMVLALTTDEGSGVFVSPPTDGALGGAGGESNQGSGGTASGGTGPTTPIDDSLQGGCNCDLAPQARRVSEGPLLIGVGLLLWVRRRKLNL